MLCSLEIAKILQQKKYTGLFSKVYDYGNNTFDVPLQCGCGRNYKSYLPCPTINEVEDWLFKEHNIFISVGIGANDNDIIGYLPDVYVTNDLSTNLGKYKPNAECWQILEDYADDYMPKSPAEAKKCAIEYVIKHLI